MQDYFRYLLWRLGRRQTVPAAFINDVPILENGEVMVDIKQDGSLQFHRDLKKQKSVFLRVKVYQLLKQAQRTLPKGYYFKICSAYRSLIEQRQLWDEECRRQQAAHPEWTRAELLRRVKAVYADPRFGFGGHQTGGALDVTLCDSKGHDYDMGTAYLEMGKSTPMWALRLSREARRNRRILYRAMAKQGFQNYPPEWWHYCYGDRMWAAYKRKKNAFYGLIEKE